MGSDDRFYLMEMRNRPVLYGDIGSLIRIEGLIIGGGGADQAMLFLPGMLKAKGEAKLVELDAEEWSDFIRRSDNPEVLVPNPDGSAGLTKIFQRKLRWEISGAVQQKVWAADGFKCMYCGAKMGQSLLTIDHFVPLELGGKNDTTNYLTACRKCNKDKGSQDPREWLGGKSRTDQSMRYECFEEYLEGRVIR